MSDLLDQNDESLMSLVQQGNHQAFSALVRRHTNRFFGTAFRLCQNEQEAEDIVQDAFVKLWNKPDAFDETKGAKFTTWFYRVVSNQALDVLRKRKKTIGGEMLDYLPDERDRADKELIEDEQQVLLERAIENLPERQKLALNLCFYEGLSNKDAADVMDVNVKALESLLMRAKVGVRDILIRDGVMEVRNAKAG